MITVDRPLDPDNLKVVRPAQPLQVGHFLGVRNQQSSQGGQLEERRKVIQLPWAVDAEVLEPLEVKQRRQVGTKEWPLEFQSSKRGKLSNLVEKRLVNIGSDQLRQRIFSDDTPII
jgi:hypothetical protein